MNTILTEAKERKSRELHLSIFSSRHTSPYRFTPKGRALGTHGIAGKTKLSLWLIRHYVHVGAQVCLLPSAPKRKSLSSRFIHGEEFQVLFEHWVAWAPDHWGGNKRDCAIS